VFFCFFFPAGNAAVVVALGNRNAFRALLVVKLLALFEEVKNDARVEEALFFFRSEVEASLANCARVWFTIVAAECILLLFFLRFFHFIHK
jgi:hypothetical protein